MGMKERRALRAAYERDSFGTGGRTAVGADGKPTARYFEMLEEAVASMKGCPILRKTDPKKLRAAMKKQTTIFDAGAK